MAARSLVGFDAHLGGERHAADPVLLLEPLDKALASRPVQLVAGAGR